MLREAELFAMAEQMLVEVLGRIRDVDRDIMLPPLHGLPGIDADASMTQVVERYVRDDACVPDVIAGRQLDDGQRTARRSQFDVDPYVAVAAVASAASAAAAAVGDGAAVVHAGYGDGSARDYLLWLTVTRSLVAHYVAAYLGSTACPLPEALARALWELTRDDAEQWRTLGLFHAPLPVPELASWRDTFLRTAGHEPHPLGH